MALLTCPNCGPRATEEFAYGGEMPRIPDGVTDPDERNIHWVWLVDNPDGPVVERWFHAAGCRRWYTNHRDTHTDRAI